MTDCRKYGWKVPQLILSLYKLLLDYLLIFCENNWCSRNVIENTFLILLFWVARGIHMTCIDKPYVLLRTKNKTKQLLFSRQYKAVTVQLQTGQLEVWLMRHAVRMPKSCWRGIHRRHRRRILCMCLCGWGQLAVCWTGRLLDCHKRYRKPISGHK